MDTKPASTEAALVGQNIRAARKRLGYTGEDVQRLAGIDPTSLSFFERGIREPNVRHLRRLAKALRVPLASFFLPRRGRIVARRPREAARQVSNRS